MKKTIKLHIIDFSDSLGIERCELTSNMSALQFSCLLHAVCKDHDQPLTEGALRFLSPQSGRWIGPEEVLFNTQDIGSEVIAVSETVRRDFGDDPSPYLALVRLRAESEEIARRQRLEEFVDSIVKISSTLEDALERPRRLVEAKPGIIPGITIDLLELWSLIRERWEAINR